MRAILSLAGLLIVLFIVFQLTGKQLSSSKVSAGDPAASAAQPPRQQAQRVADDIQRAMEQGAASRAAEAASQ